MPRGSDKHGPRMDEQLEREAHDFVKGTPEQPRVQENRQQEGPGSDEPMTDGLLHGGRETTTLSHDEAELRSRIAASIDRTVFPAARDEIVRSAEANDAEDAVMRALHRLPEQTYENVEAIWEMLGGRAEHRT